MPIAVAKERIPFDPEKIDEITKKIEDFSKKCIEEKKGSVELIKSDTGLEVRCKFEIEEEEAIPVSLEKKAEIIRISIDDVEDIEYIKSELKKVKEFVEKCKKKKGELFISKSTVSTPLGARSAVEFTCIHD